MIGRLLETIRCSSPCTRWRKLIKTFVSIIKKMVSPGACFERDTLSTEFLKINGSNQSVSYLIINVHSHHVPFLRRAICRGAICTRPSCTRMLNASHDGLTGVKHEDIIVHSIGIKMGGLVVSVALKHEAQGSLERNGNVRFFLS